MKAAVLFCLTLAGCSLPALTARQEQVYRAFDYCKWETNADTAQLQHVTPEGNYRWTSREGNQFSAMQECLTARGHVRHERPAEPRRPPP